jgi:hypothetical protein
MHQGLTPDVLGLHIGGSFSVGQASSQSVAQCRIALGAPHDQVFVAKRAQFLRAIQDTGSTPADIVAAMSSQSSASTHRPASAPFVVIVAKQNGLFRQSGAILGLHSGDPTLVAANRKLRSGTISYGNVNVSSWSLNPLPPGKVEPPTRFGPTTVAPNPWLPVWGMGASVNQVLDLRS